MKEKQLTDDKIFENRIDCVEGLRGISAFIVFLSHYVVAFFPEFYWGGEGRTVHITGGSSLAQSPFQLFYAGDFAVCIFFVISGFGCSYAYFCGHNGEERIKEIGMLRYLRLMLPCFISIILCFLLKAARLTGNETCATITGSQWLEQQMSGSMELRGVLLEGLAGVLFIGESTYNAALWTMTYLFWGSMAVIFMLFMFGGLQGVKRLLIYISIAVLLLLSSFYDYRFINYAGFLGGMAFADYWSHYGKEGVIKRVAPVLLCAGLLLGGYPCGVIPSNFYRFIYFENSFRFWHVLGALLVVFSVFYLDPVKRILSTSFCKKMGLISFSVYLLHLPVLCSFSSRLFLNLINCELGYLTTGLIVMVSTVLLVLTVSCCFYKYIEKPIYAFLKKGYRKIIK